VRFRFRFNGDKWGNYGLVCVFTQGLDWIVVVLWFLVVGLGGWLASGWGFWWSLVGGNVVGR